MCACEARRGHHSSRSATLWRRLRCLWGLWGLSTLLLAEVGPALLQELSLLLQNVTNLLQEALLVMEDVVSVLHKGKAEHEKDAWRAAQSLLPLLRAEQSLDQVVARACVVQILLFLF